MGGGHTPSSPILIRAGTNYLFNTMKPTTLQTKLFLDSGDPQETLTLLDVLGFVDGQTTNPSLVAKNPEVQSRIQKGSFRKEELYDLYKDLAGEISTLLPKGSVSVEVYADLDTRYDDMLAEARQMNEWIPNAHVKLPITEVGLQVAQTLVSDGVNVNMTLCFTQEQAAAVYQVTKGASKGQVYISPFIGRLDDRGINGMNLVENIERMYAEGDGHVQVLAASIRRLEHLMAAISVGADIVTAPTAIYEEWVQAGKVVPDESYQYQPQLDHIQYQEGLLESDDLSIHHELTDAGLAKFAADWNALLG